MTTMTTTMDDFQASPGLQPGGFSRKAGEGLMSRAVSTAAPYVAALLPLRVISTLKPLRSPLAASREVSTREERLSNQGSSSHGTKPPG